MPLSQCLTIPHYYWNRECWFLLAGAVLPLKHFRIVDRFLDIAKDPYFACNRNRESLMTRFHDILHQFPFLS